MDGHQSAGAGKHVLVEKPIALSIAEADSMVAAARKSGKFLMVGHVLPFFPEFAYALEAVRSGRFGSLRAAHLLRVISKPDWSQDIADADRSGGPAIDLHIHDTHFIGLICGVPRSVHSCGVVDNGTVAHLTTQYLYDTSNQAVSCISGALSQKGRPFAARLRALFREGHGLFRVRQSRGPVHLATPLSVILPDGTVDRPELGSGDPVDGFVRELTDATQAIVSGSETPRLAGELARQALRICLAEIESVKTGKAVALS